MHTNTTGGPTDRPVLHRRPEDAADQPTTEPSEAVIETVGDAHVEAMVDAWGDEGGGYDFEVMARALIERGWTAPAPHPAADTERDERLREARERAALIRSTYQDGDHLQPGALDDLTVLVLDDEVSRLDAVVIAVRGLHKRNPLWDNEAEKAAGYYNTNDMCVECLDDWPCATVQALNEGV